MSTSSLASELKINRNKLKDLQRIIKAEKTDAINEMIDFITLETATIKNEYPLLSLKKAHKVAIDRFAMMLTVEQKKAVTYELGLAKWLANEGLFSITAYAVTQAHKCRAAKLRGKKLFEALKEPSIEDETKATNKIVVNKKNLKSNTPFILQSKPKHKEVVQVKTPAYKKQLSDIAEAQAREISRKEQEKKHSEKTDILKLMQEQQKAMEAMQQELARLKNQQVKATAIVEPKKGPTGIAKRESFDGF
jgi:hypothetical protein